MFKRTLDCGHGPRDGSATDAARAHIGLLSAHILCLASTAQSALGCLSVHLSRDTAAGPRRAHPEASVFSR
eukprot:scaffold111846_cov69-Phaeocystis_antarctica.AAC.1